MIGVDLSGQVFNYLTVINKSNEYYTFSGGTKVPLWVCECVCGNSIKTYASKLKCGYKKSCGCKNYLGEHKNKKYDRAEAGYRAKVSNYKAHAKMDNREWHLSIEEAVGLLKSDCHYCGSSPSNEYNLIRNRKQKNKTVVNTYESIYYNGIDRVDSSKGYSAKNCVSCCKICNQAKMDMTVDQFEEWIDRLIKFRGKK